MYRDERRNPAAADGRAFERNTHAAKLGQNEDTLRDAAVQGPLVTLALAAPWIIATSWPLAGAGEGRLAA